MDLIDAELVRDRLGGRAGVAGQHHYSHTFCTKLTNRVQRRCLDGIRDSDETLDGAIDDDVHHRFTVAPHALGLLGRLPGKTDAQIL